MNIRKVGALHAQWRARPRDIAVRATPRDSLIRGINGLRVSPSETELIRVGRDFDGGYLIPDDLDGIAACFSPGAAGRWSFEDELLARFGIPSYVCDVEEAVADCPHTADAFLLGPYTSSGVMSLADWVAMRAPEDRSDLLLQMDIEGGEFLTLLAAPVEVLLRFRIIVLELHGLERMAAGLFFDSLAYPLIVKLRDAFEVVHLHANNAQAPDLRSGIDLPRALEVTLLRRDRFRSANGVPLVPHPLDRPNVPGRPAVELSDMWTSAHVRPSPPVSGWDVRSAAGPGCGT